MNEKLKKQLEEVFSTQITPVKKTFAYRVSLVLVTVVMLMLAVSYFAVFACIVYAVIYHAGVNYSFLASRIKADESAFFLIIIYIIPIIVGSILAVSMSLPLIPGSIFKRYVCLYKVTEESDPDFYHFIAMICKTIKAPMPKQIELTVEPNASASFQGGFRDFIKKEQPVLRIGLPLLTSLNIRQLAGIIAHEMGHFSQGNSVRLSCIIKGVHYWFYRSVYRGGILSEKFERYIDQMPPGTIALFIFFQLFWYITKLILFLFMSVSFLVSNFMSRQMEYDADMYWMSVSGSSLMENTLYAIHLLEISFQETLYMSLTTWKSGFLVDDLPFMMRAYARLIAENNHERIIDSILSENTRIFDTHPSVKDRIRRARQKNCAGMCHISQAVGELFLDFRALTGKITAGFYREYFGLDISRRNLKSVNDYLKYYKEVEYTV